MESAEEKQTIVYHSVPKMNNPKVQWLGQFVTSGSTTVVGTEDLEYWKNLGYVDIKTVDQLEKRDSIFLAEVLQKVENPVKLLQEVKEKAGRIAIIVPNEHGWAANNKPLTNKEHKRVYDAELLSNHLEEAGLDYVIEQIDYQGWSFLTAQCVRSEK